MHCTPTYLSSPLLPSVAFPPALLRLSVLSTISVCFAPPPFYPPQPHPRSYPTPTYLPSPLILFPIAYPNLSSPLTLYPNLSSAPLPSPYPLLLRSLSLKSPSPPPTSNFSPILLPLLVSFPFPLPTSSIFPQIRHFVQLDSVSPHKARSPRSAFICRP